MRSLVLIFLCLIIASVAQAQNTLPNISVTNIGGKIVVSWKNAYQLPASVINIQRSYDSLKNFTTIGSVLTPQNKENGFADDNPPYLKMFYRVFVSFEGGRYLFSDTKKPGRFIERRIVKTADGRDSVVEDPAVVLLPWQLNPFDSLHGNFPFGTRHQSQRLFSTKDNSIILHLPDAISKKYIVRFFDEENRKVFELNKLNEEFLIIEKVNFKKSGVYRFQIIDNGIVIEENSITVAKDFKPKH